MIFTKIMILFLLNGLLPGNVFVAPWIFLAILKLQKKNDKECIFQPYCTLTMNTNHRTDSLYCYVVKLLINTSALSMTIGKKMFKNDSFVFYYSCCLWRRSPCKKCALQFTMVLNNVFIRHRVALYWSN